MFSNLEVKFCSPLYKIFNPHLAFLFVNERKNEKSTDILLYTGL